MLHEKCISQKPGVLRDRDHVELAQGRRGACYEDTGCLTESETEV